MRPTVDRVAGVEADVDAADPRPGTRVGEQLRTGRLDHRAVATRVVAVLVGIEHLRDLPALVLGPRQALVVVQRVDGKRLAGLRAGDQVVEIAVGVAGPDLLDEHHSCLSPTPPMSQRIDGSLRKVSGRVPTFGRRAGGGLNACCARMALCARGRATPTCGG